MPLSFPAGTTSGTTYANPFVGKPGPSVQLKVDVSDLNADSGSGGEVDTNGWLRPGAMFDVAGGLLVHVGTGGRVYGVVMEPTPLVVAGFNKGTVTSTTLDSDTDQPIAVCTSGVVNRDIIEDNLGRALTSDEVAGFNIAGSLLRLTET